MLDRRRYIATSFPVGLVLVLFFSMVPDAHGQEVQPMVVGKSAPEQIDENWKDCGLRKLEQDAHVSHRPDPTKQQKASANIEVDYGEGFTSEARAAFERAVEIWETHISSPMTIRIEASFEQFDNERALGGASPNGFYFVDRNEDGEFDAILGDPLAEAYVGGELPEDQNPNPPDIVASFNQDRDDWHFGSEDAPSDDIDFTSVVLHEIAHGLNYVDLFDYNEETGEGEHGGEADGERIAGIYGQHVVEEKSDGRFLHLTNEDEYPVPSEVLGDALTSQQLFFTGENSNLGASQSNGPVPPKLYAPPEFDRGSSLSHLDEDTYTFETVNALMTPSIAAAETIRLPGPIVCGQLRDMGWDIGPGCAFEDIAIESVTVDQVRRQRTNRGEVELSWQLEGGENLIEGFIVEHQYYDESFEEVKRVSADGPGPYNTSIDSLQPGRHSFRLKYVFSGGGEVQSGRTVEAFIEAQRPEISVYPNPFTEVAKVSFVLPERQEVRVEVYDILGRQVAVPFVGVRPADDARPVRFNAAEFQGLGSGVYFFRVIGADFTETVKAVRVL